MKAYAFKHQSDRTLYALSIDKTGANLPNGPWKYWKDATIRPKGVIGYNPVKADRGHRGSGMAPPSLVCLVI